MKNLILSLGRVFPTSCYFSTQRDFVCMYCVYLLVIIAFFEGYISHPNMTSRTLKKTKTYSMYT